MLFCRENIKTYPYVLFLVFARLGVLFSSWTQRNTQNKKIVEVTDKYGVSVL
nr:hypothetical protein [Clostridioides difficile]